MDTINKKELEIFKISGDWDLQSKLLRRKFPQLTPSDLEFQRDGEKDLFKRIEKRLNKKESEVVKIIKETLPDKFINNLKIKYHE
ncbi:hypothetical protein [Flavobacterium paronense]|uniref:General stress protein CsbD n=2 Tax=Flavobacterium paronense TaxID=1392775 RepID=A0ABV5GGF6_9FLAO